MCYAAYLKLIDSAGKAVAIGMAVCGLGFGLCVKCNEYLTVTLRQEWGIWAWGAVAFGIGVLACLIATLALVVEYLARPAPARFTVGSVFIRSLLLLAALVAIFLGMLFGFGDEHAIGAVIGTYLLLAALRAHGAQRLVLAVLTTIVLGLTLLGMQSAHQFARWHADEIVAAGCNLMDQCPRTGYRTYDRYEIACPSDPTRFGHEIEPTDPRVPSVLRRLGARRIWVDEERVAVYVGTDLSDLFMSFCCGKS